MKELLKLMVSIQKILLDDSENPDYDRLNKSIRGLLTDIETYSKTKECPKRVYNVVAWAKDNRRYTFNGEITMDGKDYPMIDYEGVKKSVKKIMDKYLGFDVGEIVLENTIYSNLEDW